MPVLMIPYDTEMFGPDFTALDQWLGDRVNDHSITSRWIEKASELHTRLDAPFTSFVVGKLIELHPGEFKAMVDEVPQMDVQSHTYSHVILKTIVFEPSAEYLEVRPLAQGPGTDEERGVKVGRGESLEVIRSELVKTRELIEEVCGVDCIGISGPGGYYRGLSDRLDVLRVVWEEGNRISRCYSRNQDDFGPIPWDKQPFWYKAQGFPDLLEIPVQDWQDVFWRDLYGWNNISGYLHHLKKGIDIIVEQDLAWAVGLHEWSVIENDPEMTVVEGLIKYAQDRGVELLSCKQYYQRRLADRVSSNGRDA